MAVIKIVKFLFWFAISDDLNTVRAQKMASFDRALERFSNECRKTKTKVITPANHNKHKLPNEPIRTRGKNM